MYFGWSDRSQIWPESFLAHTKAYKRAKLPLLKLSYFWSTPLPIPIYDQYKDIAAEMIATITARGMYVQI